MKETTVTCEAQVENLPVLLLHLERVCGRADVDPETAAALRLAVEEVCVNVIKHGYSAHPGGPIHLACGADADEVRVVVTDEAPPFDPTQIPPPDLGAAWEDRPIGGLGWHLVQETMDEVRHEQTPQGGNRLTLIKRRPHRV